MMKFLYLLCCLGCLHLETANALFKTDWTRSFYTDDSSRYLTLYADGFTQILRVDKSACAQITRVNVLLKDSETQTTFKELKSANAPSLYGLNAADYCWYEVSVHGLKLEQGIEYILKIEDRSRGLFYFRGLSQSLIPFERLVKEVNQNTPWIQLGAFGATPVSGGGVYYKIWEPYSDEVHLFINEKKIAPLAPRFSLNDERRFHYAFIKNSRPTDAYYFKFVKGGSYEEVETGNIKELSSVKIDPMARELYFDKKGGKLSSYKNPRARVSLPDHYPWRYDHVVPSMKSLDYDNWIIYQLWPLTFNPREVQGRYVQGQFVDILPKIPYLKDLGVNAVEFLPVFESRFKASWGYALDSLLVLESTLGTKDEMKKVIDSFHAHQMRVIFDVVLNHVNNNLIRDPLDPDRESSSKFYSGETAWGPKPRFESIWVRKWMADSLLEVMAEYHLDGFRFDMTDSIFRGSASGYYFLQELMYLIKVNGPRFYNSAEQLPNDVWVTYPIGDNGLGFDAQWNDRFKNFFELEFDHYSEMAPRVDLTYLAHALLGYSDHQKGPGEWYPFGHPQRTVNYLGSHDFIGNKNPLIRIVSQYQSEEREGHNTFTRVNPLEDGRDVSIPFRKIHTPFTHALTRLAYGILFTKPGAALFYQGEELAQDLNIENEWSYLNAVNGNRFPSQDIDLSRYVRSHRMVWPYYELAQGRRVPPLQFATEKEQRLFQGHLDFFKTMIEFKRSNPDMNEWDAQNVSIDNEEGLITYEIRTPRAAYFVVGHFKGDKAASWISFPGGEKVWWREIINSASFDFGGESDALKNIISQLGGRNNLVRLPGPALMIFKAESAPAISETLYFRSSAFQWKADQTTEMRKGRGAHEFSVELYFTKEETIEFKLGTKDWGVDLGKAQAPDTLTYAPLGPNVRANIRPGKYLFVFNVSDYTYRLQKM